MWSREKKSHLLLGLRLHQGLGGHEKGHLEDTGERSLGRLAMTAFILICILVLLLSFLTCLASFVPFLWLSTRGCLRLVASFGSLSGPALGNPVWLGLYPLWISNFGYLIGKLLSFLSLWYATNSIQVLFFIESDTHWKYILSLCGKWQNPYKSASLEDLVVFLNSGVNCSGPIIYICMSFCIYGKEVSPGSSSFHLVRSPTFPVVFFFLKQIRLFE